MHWSIPWEGPRLVGKCSSGSNSVVWCLMILPIHLNQLFFWLIPNFYLVTKKLSETTKIKTLKRVNKQKLINT